MLLKKLGDFLCNFLFFIRQFPYGKRHLIYSRCSNKHYTVGYLDNNAKKIIQYIQRARELLMPNIRNYINML